MQTYNFVLGVGQEIKIPCQNIDFIGCTVGTSDFKIMPEGFDPLDFALGLAVKLEKRVDKIIIINGAVAQTISLVLGRGVIFDNRLVGTLNITGGVNAKGNTGQSNAAVTVTAAGSVIKALTVSRSKLTIQNLGTVDIYVGGAGVTVANGIRLSPNGSMDVTSIPAVSGISSGVDCDVRYWEETV